MVLGAKGRMSRRSLFGLATSMTILAPGCGPNAPVVAGKDARAGTGQQTPARKGTLHSFTLHNTSGTTATQTIARLGLAFLKGDVPAGKRIVVRQRGGPQIAFAAAAATNTWADGSLRSTADGGLVMIDGVELPAGDSRTYEVFVKDGAIATSGFDPFAWLAAHGNDLTVAVTARTGSATGPRPDLLFSLKTAIATTTRREILSDTRRFVRIKAWQKVPQEEHLICEYHLDFWLDGTGQPWGLEFAPVLTQHWWVADPFGTTQTKERQTYDAVVKYGTTVLDTRTRLDHAYYCRWASLRPQDDAQHARKHWIGLGLSQMPTVRVQYDDSSLKRMMKAGYIPPLRLGVNYTMPTRLSNDLHAPRAQRPPRLHPSSGGYVGRGIGAIPTPSWSVAAGPGHASDGGGRLAQLARHGAGRACRSTSTFAITAAASGVNGGTDAPTGLIPLPFGRRLCRARRATPASASPVIYTRGATQDTHGFTVLIQDAPTGGTGAMSGYDDAHAHNYCGPMAFLEGEAYLGDAAVSQFNGQSFCSYWNIYGHDAPLLYASSSRGANSGRAEQHICQVRHLA